METTTKERNPGMITNGDFEGGIPDEVHQADVGSPWFDFDNLDLPGNL